jgi:hypothetical protein
MVPDVLELACVHPRCPNHLETFPARISYLDFQLFV